MTNKLPKLFAMATFFMAIVAVFTVLNTHSASAATLNVTTNDVSPAANADGCTLREAIQNINDQAQTNTDCAAGDGSTDTIIIPSGAIILSASLPVITEPAVVIGQGMDVSIVDGDGGAYTVFRAEDSDLTIEGLTISGFLNVALQFSGNNALRVSSLEIDGASSQTDNTFAHGGLLAAASNIAIDNAYVHSISASGLSFSVYGMVFQAVQGGTSDISISNSTVQGITSQDTSVVGISLATGLLDGSLTPGYINIDIQNTTISNLNGGAAGALGIASLPVVNGGDSEININARNNTISSIDGGNGGAFSSATAIFLTGAALGAQDTTTSTFTGMNNILETSQQHNCLVLADAAPLVTGGSSAGIVTSVFTSQGGNLSSDDSCSPCFTNSTDQNNVAALAASLLPLADNGGSVPTMALKEGSPAIDSGITVSGLITDARGSIRPQGTAYDSGAYESPYSKPTAPQLAESGENILVPIFAIIAALPVLLLVHKRLGYRTI